MNSSNAARAAPVAVLIVTEEVGGHERMLLEWLADARALGLVPTIHCRPETELQRAVLRAGFTCRALTSAPARTPAPLAKAWDRFVGAWRAVSRLPRGATVLLAPGAMQASHASLLACLLLRRPVVCYVPMAPDSATLQATHAAARDWITGLLTSRVALWITVTEQQRQQLLGRWKIRAPVHVVPNRIHLLGGQQPERLPSSTADVALQVLYIGRFDPWQKGLDWLADLLANPPQWVRRFSFVFQGRGPFQPELEALSEPGPLCDVRVQPWGDVSEALHDADVVLLASRFEGFPVIAIEATHVGVPVVATLQSGLADLLPPSSLFRFGDVDGFRAALESLLEPAARAEAVAHARRRMDNMLSDTEYKRSVAETVQGIRRLRDAAAA